MNDLLQLKGNLHQEKSKGRPGSKNIPKGKNIKLKQLIHLRDNLDELYSFWKQEIGRAHV